MNEDKIAGVFATIVMALFLVIGLGVLVLGGWGFIELVNWVTTLG